MKKIIFMLVVFCVLISGNVSGIVYANDENLSAGYK
jgi:hypothetical protein